MPYDTLSAADRSRTYVFLPPIATQQKRFLSGIRLLSVCSLVGIAWTTVRRCVCDLERVSEGFYFFNYIDFGVIKVRCHVAGSQNGVDRQCYDWTETNSMFRLLIGICGSYSVDPWSRFRRLHFSYLLSLFSYIYIVLLIIYMFLPLILKDNWFTGRRERMLWSRWWLFIYVGITGWISHWCQSYWLSEAS